MEIGGNYYWRDLRAGHRGGCNQNGKLVNPL